MKKIVSLALVLLVMQVVQGQKGYSSLTYSIGFPLGDLGDYIDEVSYRGLTAEFYWHVKSNFDVGFEAGWNVFYKKEEKKTYTSETASINGVQFRYTNAVPLLAGVRWRRTKSGNKMAPYLGVGAGATSMNRATDFGLYRITNSSWQFCVRPEGGFIYKMSDAVAATAGVKYYANFENDDLAAQTYATVNLGFVFAFGH